MAKRKSSNKRLSRYNRSSIRSGYLDPNSEVLGEEEPFWWNNLTSSANQSLMKSNVANQTSRYLDSDTQVDLSNASNGWWNALDSTDSEVFHNLRTVQTNRLPDAIPKTTKAIISGSDEEDSSLPPQKRKVMIRGKLKKSKSNPFLKAFVDSESSKLSKSLQNTTVAKPAKDLSVNYESSKESDFIDEHKGKKDNVSVSDSTDHSHSTGKILKSKPQVFRKKYKEKKDSVFEDLLKSAENKPNETETTEMVPINSSNKLIERNKVYEGSVSNVLEEHNTDELKERARQTRSLIRNVSTRSITHSEISKNDGNLIYYERSDSSFEIQSDHAKESLQKEPSITENPKNQNTNSIHSSQTVNNFHVNDGTTKSPENNDNNYKSLKHISRTRTLNTSNISQTSTHSGINNSKRLFDKVEQENMNKEDMIQETNIENVISQSLSTNKTVTNTSNIPLFKRRKSDLKIDSSSIEVSVKNKSNTINDSTSNVIKNVAKERLTNDGKINDLRKQMNTTNSHSKTLSKDVIDYKNNNNEQLDAEISTPSSKRMSIHTTANFNEENLSNINNKTRPKESDMDPPMSKQKSKRTIGRQSKTLMELKTDKLNKESFSRDNDKAQLEELNMGASTSKQKSNEITNIFNNNNDQNVYEMEQLCHKTKNPTNLDRQKRINEYFRPSSFKLNSEINEREEIKKRLKHKKQKLDLYLDKIQVPMQLNKKEIRERIKKLESGMKKQPIKAEIHRAYLVNGKRYKRPKLPRPKPWVTDRFYRHLWKVMEPKYKLLTRVESEKFVQRLSNSVSVIIKSKKYENYKNELDDLLSNMARLGIIHTLNDFYNFSYEFLPYDFRVKVVPMIMAGNVRNIPYDPEKLHEPLLVK